MNRKTIFLCGFMGVGKTAVGRLLARRLGMRFYDSDAEIERLERMSVADVFAQKGEPHFRRLERRVVASLAARGGVISLGGGALLDRRTAALARERAVALTCSERELWRRLKTKLYKRPLLFGGRLSLRALLAGRKTLYKSVLLKVSTTRRSPREAAALIARRLAILWR